MNEKNPLTTGEQDVQNNQMRDDLERIADPMSVVLGYTQLLLRRIRRGQAIDEEEMLRVLGLIEQASRATIAGLSQAARRARTGKGNARSKQ